MKEREREKGDSGGLLRSVNWKKKTLRKCTKKRGKKRAVLTGFHDLTLLLTRCPSGLRYFPFTVAYVSLAFVLHLPTGDRRVDVCVVLLLVVVVVVWGGDLPHCSMAWCKRTR